jgi:hypothetical protein
MHSYLDDIIFKQGKPRNNSRISDCYRYQMDLSTNAGIVEEAMRFHSSNTELLNTMTKQHKQEQGNGNISISESDTSSNTNTTNGVF